MTRAKTICAWVALAGSALALRIGLALGSPNIFFPDEIFQTLEPAHRLVYGYGVISWEWRLGIRSWVLPTFLASVMRATAWMGSASAGYLLGTTIALSLISLIAVWFGYAWAKRASGTPAAIIAAVACCFYFGFVYFAPKALYEVVAAHVLLPGLYLGVYGEKLGERKRLFFAGLFCVVAAGASLPVLLFGITDWITWSYPWQSFVLYYKENVVSGPGKELTIVQPWYWYALVLLVLLGPAVLLLFHGVRRSPFLAIFCAIIVVSHSVIPHKEIRFIYPILAPAITLAAMGIVDLLQEIKHGLNFLDNPRWVVAIGVAFFLVSSGLLAVHCADWYKTRWGGGAFDRLSREPAVCGVGIYRSIWWESGGYTHLHRDVPIIAMESAAQLANDAPSFNALIAPAGSPGLPSGFTQPQCWQGVCLSERPGTCAPPPAGEELNEYLKRIGH